MDEGTGPELRPGTKAGRNERRKILAAFLNTVGAASLLIGLLRPVLGSIGGERTMSPREIIASLLFSALGIILHGVAQFAMSRLEE